MSAHDAILIEEGGAASLADPDFLVGDELIGRQRQISGAGPLRIRPEVSYTEPWHGQKKPS